MKKVINGKLYNTDSAKYIGKAYTGEIGSLYSFNESLYKTRSGAYFIHGNGNAGSRYSKWEGNSCTGAEEIIPMSYDNAKKWASKNLTADEYQEIFGAIEEASDNKVIISASISQAAKQMLDRMQSEQGRAQSEIIESLIIASYK